MTARIYDFQTGRDITPEPSPDESQQRAVREAALRNKIDYHEKQARIHRQALARIALENLGEGDET